MTDSIFSACPTCNELRIEYLDAWMTRGPEGRTNHARLIDAQRALKEHEDQCPIAKAGLYAALWPNAVVGKDEAG